MRRVNHQMAGFRNFGAQSSPTGGGVSILVGGLTNGKTYMCWVSDINLDGASALSAPSVSFVVGGAVGGTTCKTLSGSVTFSPALPKLGSKSFVLATMTAKSAKVSGCTGGGVTGGTVAMSATFSKPGNCTTVTTSGIPVATKGSETITWNTKAKSTLALTLAGVKGTPSRVTIAGTVTTGLFKGLKETGTVSYAIPTPAPGPAYRACP